MVSKFSIAVIFLFSFFQIALAQQTDSIIANDKAGINPLDVANFIELTNQYIQPVESQQSNYSIYLKYGYRIKDSRINVNVKIPYVIASQTREGTVSGFANIVLGANCVPYITDKNGLALTCDLNLITGDKRIRNEKNDLTPGVTFVFYHVGSSIIAPSYKQSFTLANFGNYANTNQGSIDVKYSRKSLNKKQWIMFDPMFTVNYSDGSNYFSVKAEAGILIFRSLSIAFKPGYSTIGDDKWSIALPVKMVF